MAKVHLIGNAHLDPVWLWRWQEGYSEVLATFRSALDRMVEFDDYIFTCAGACYYKWVEETDPAMFEEIRQRVQEGRWVIVGGWWIQPDCNAPSSESFARHALYSQRYYMEKFGRKAEIGYNVDSFGHNAMLPQLLKESGLRGYVFMRPNPFEEKTYPFPNTAFLWEGADGTKIPTFRISNAYCCDLPNAVSWTNEALERAEKFSHPDMCFYGVGNHGGGPTIKVLKALNELIKESKEGDISFSSPNAFFDELDVSKIPLLSDELQHHASGCYTTVMEIKELNRKAELQLAAAEKYAALAEWLGFRIDVSPLAEAWQNVLFNQFHDVMGGCSIREAMEDAVIDLKHAIHAAQQVTNKALQKLSWNMDTSRGQEVIRSKSHFRLWSRETLGTPLTVFNPHSWPVRALVRTGGEIGGEITPFIETGDGALLPYQRGRSSVTNGEHDKWEYAFVDEIPAMGWKTFWINRGEGKKAATSKKTLIACDTRLENDWLIAEFAKETGALIRLYDKMKNQELIARPTSALVIDETEADTWAHRIFEFRSVAGEFGGAKVELVESGEVYAKLKITTEYGKSLIKKYVTLYRELPGLYMSYVVEWNESHRMLKLAFPTPFSGGEVSGIAGGALKRHATGMEEHMHSWVNMGGLSIVTDTRAAYDALDGEVRITALRSPAYADHFGARDGFCEPMAQGEHRFQLVLTAETDPLVLSRMAAELICPPERILGTYHKGALKEADEGLVAGGSVIVDAVKKSEDGSGWVIRIREAGGLNTQAKISLPMLGRTVEADFTPYQIRTFLLTETGLIETDFTETAK